MYRTDAAQHIMTAGYNVLFADLLVLYVMVCPICDIQFYNKARPRERSDRGRFLPSGTVLTGSVHAHIPTKPSRAGFAAIRLELIEPGAEACVYQAKAWSPTDQPVREFKYGLGIYMTMQTFFTCLLYTSPSPRD